MSFAKVAIFSHSSKHIRIAVQGVVGHDAQVACHGDVPGMEIGLQGVGFGGTVVTQGKGYLFPVFVGNEVQQPDQLFRTDVVAL